MNEVGILRLNRRYRLLRRMATLCVVLVLALTSISAFLRLSQAGLGCAPWPQCYGSKLRQAQQGIETGAADSPSIVNVRLLHRAAAVATLILIVAMLHVCFAESPKLWREAALALALLALAIFLAVLGRWTAGSRLPAVAIGNLLGGLAMLALSWRLRQQAGAASTAPAAVRHLARLSLAVLLCQIALGGLVSASYAGLSCTGLPDCGGSLLSWWPAQASLEAFNPWHEPVLLAQSAADPTGAAPHMAHRYAALAVSLALAPLGLSLLSSGRRRVAAVLLSLLAIEAILGVLLVGSGLPLWAALAHNLGAALLLAVVFSLA